MKKETKMNFRNKLRNILNKNYSKNELFEAIDELHEKFIFEASREGLGKHEQKEKVNRCKQCGKKVNEFYSFCSHVCEVNYKAR